MSEPQPEKRARSQWTVPIVVASMHALLSVAVLCVDVYVESEWDDQSPLIWLALILRTLDLPVVLLMRGLGATAGFGSMVMLAVVGTLYWFLIAYLLQTVIRLLRFGPGPRSDSAVLLIAAIGTVVSGAGGVAAANETESTKHWAYRPLSAPSLPSHAASDWCAGSVDAFVLARLGAAGLKPAARAERAVLFRRVTVDLTGLPPAPERVARFLADSRPDAYEREVDRLLASHRLAETWARHWLDIVRYTETAGHVQDRVRPHAWRYRDYVIAAINEDLSYYRFVREHLAGDLLEPRLAHTDLNWSPAATGFLWFHEMHFRPVDPVVQRADQIEAQIDVVGKAFLGLTIACARCHDHKFDPISQEDYYALAGIFHSTREAPARLGARSELDASAANASERAQEIRDEIQALTEKERRSVRNRQAKKTTVAVPITETNFPPGAQDKLAALRRELTALDPHSTLWAPAAADKVGADVHVETGGEPSRPGRLVERRFLAMFSEGEAPPRLGERSGRLFLAQRISDAENPLLGRVLVNRLWQHVFGEGLVRTPNNFGRLGEMPTHPELLDHLAAEFARAGGSVKEMLRRLVTSSTFAMSNAGSAAAYEQDPDNRLLHHRPPRRVSAEVLRDSLLAVSGSLNEQRGGPSVPPWISPNATANKPVHIPKSGPLDGRGRRSIYLLVRRNFVTPFLGAFDYPDQGSSVGRRDISVVPQQALALLNSPFVELMARRWGEQVAAREGTAPERLAAMVLRALGRPVRSDEAALLLQLLGDDPDRVEGWIDVAHTLFNRTEFQFVR